MHWSLITSFVQGLLTSGYIILLSRVGERVAADMRKTLFASLLRYIFPNVRATEHMDTVKAMVPRQDAITANIASVIFVVSGKMWLSLMPIKLGSW